MYVLKDNSYINRSKKLIYVNYVLWSWCRPKRGLARNLRCKGLAHYLVFLKKTSFSFLTLED